MDKAMPRYKKEPSEQDLPAVPTLPELKICQLSEGKMIIPRDIRQSFLSDPVWSPEWREILQKFDADWGVVIPGPCASPQQPSGGSATASPQGREFWDRQFPGDPRTTEELKTKFGADLTEFAGPDASTSFFLAPGPSLYLNAKDAVLLRASGNPLVCHGAGTWLLADKAEKFLRENPAKAIPCSWDSDQVTVLIEDWGA